MKQNIKKLVLLLALSLSSTLLHAEKISKESPEFKQLSAMGYEIEDDGSDDGWAIITNGDTKILLRKGNDDLSLARVFSRNKKLTDKEELEFLRIINTINKDLSFQVSMSENSLLVAIYTYGQYNSKVLAKLTRIIEGVGIIFTKYPRLTELMNE